MSIKTRLVAAAVFSTCLTGGASADILYGDFNGVAVDYINVREDNKGLFGAPTISGDSLNFTPLEFLAEANGGTDQLTDGTLAFNVMSTSANGITTLTLEESGAFALLGTGTAVTRVEVGVVFSVNILEVNGVPYAGASQVAQGSSIFGANLVASPGLAQAWHSTAVINIAALAQANLGITGAITKASVVLDNQLYAVSEIGSRSFIDKKSVDAVTITVPEPASIALLVLGGVALISRRRSA